MKFTKITKTSKNNEIPKFFPGWFEERFKGHYAQISTVNTLKLKNSCRDVARFKLGTVPTEIENLVKGFLVPPQGVNDKDFIFGKNTPEGFVPGSIETDMNLQEYIRKYPDHWEIVQDCLMLWRSKGRHAAGYVITNEPIDEFAPIITISGVRCLDFTGPQVEAVGGVKYDFLVVNSLSDIQACVKLIQQRYFKKIPENQTINNIKVPGTRIVPYKGNSYDIWDLPEEKEVFDDIGECKTETVFQLDSSSARKWLPLFKGLFNTIEDISVFTALDRPGPLEYFVTNPDNPTTKHSMLVEYARRARGLQKSPDVVKELDGLCSETHGIMVYQESLTKVYQYFTDCTPIEAEEFRRKIGKKKKDEIDKLYTHFIEKATKKTDKQTAQEVWDSINTWSKYGFCHSHSFSYSKLAYTCLWLKHRYPLEWWTSVLQNATKDEINEKFWQHCSSLILLPDIKVSGSNWQIEGDKIRAPISLLFGMGESAHKQLAESAPYKDLDAFCRAIVDYQIKNSSIEEKPTSDGSTIKVRTWGRNALNIGKIYSMLQVGCMDGLFESNLTISEKLDIYHKKMKEMYQEHSKKYNKPKKSFPNLDAIGRYQAKKSILPLYGEDLRPMIIELGIPDYLVVDGKSLRIRNKVFSKEVGREVNTFDPVINASNFSKLELLDDFVDKYYRFGIIAYLEKKEKINWGENKSKEAYKLFVEFGGLKKEFIAWPNYDGIIDSNIKEVQEGSIIALVVDKRKGKEDFTIRSIQIIREALGEKDEKSLDT